MGSSSARSPPRTLASTSGASGRCCWRWPRWSPQPAVAVAGLIGFVGLVIPHLVRLIVGPNARLVLPISMLFGASLLAMADVVARMLGDIPVGVVTAVIGAPFFLALLRRARTGYEL